MTTQEKWSKLKTLFAQCLEQPEHLRDAWLDIQCADDADLRDEVRRLLAQQRQPAQVFAADAAELLGKLMPQADVADALLGKDIGPYRLTRLLGEGGMGRVYLAERIDGQFTQQVALKVVRAEFATPELQQRFLRERDTLARLVHPNIAQLYDGGVSGDGAPFFTLEFIAGEPITRWSDERRLDIRGRLQLMIKVSDAVQYAHRNLIVHRDLKPSNILVTADGEPKLLDFGIAKPLANVADELTNTQATPMTREYAAPEQVLGDPVTTATDVYSLGVLLYLLLCGQMPYRRAALGEISWIKAILEEMPEPLERAVDRDTGNGDATALAASRSTSLPALKRSLRGDLERIVQRALAKSPEARYPTVSAMADDLRAYMAGRAISGGTRTYRMRKFARRHWLPLSAGALLFLVVLASAIGLAWEASEVERQARTTTEVKKFILELFQKANPNIAQGKVVTVRDAVDFGVQRLDTIPASQPELKAELQVTLGNIYYQLTLHKQAATLHAQAFETLKSYPRDALLAVSAERFEATEIATLGDLGRAQELADDALERIRAIAHAPVKDLVYTIDTANWIAARLHRLERSKELIDAAFAAVTNADVDDDTRSLALGMKADYARRMRDSGTAVTYYRQALALNTDEQTSISKRQGLGAALQDLCRYDEAAEVLQKALEATNRSFGESSGRALRIGQTLGINEFSGGHVRQAATQFAHLLQLAESHTPRDESVINEIRLNYAEMLESTGKPDQAEPLLLAANDFLKSQKGSDPLQIAETLSSLGQVYIDEGKLDLAEKYLRETLDYIAANKVDDTALALARLSYVRLLRGDVAGAVSLGQQARDNAVKVGGERTFDTALTHYYFGRALEAVNQRDQGESEYRAAIASHAAMLPPEGMHPASADARFALAALLLHDSRNRDEATRLAEQALTLREQALGANNPRTREAQAQLAKLQMSH